MTSRTDAAAGSVVAAGGATVCLLVDDLEENLLALEALLRREDGPEELVLLKARTGVQALELLLTHDVALALLDVQMPGMDGFELAEFMRGSERTRRVPIIFLTAGSSDSQRRFRGYEAGAVDYITKPIEPAILRGKANVFFALDRQRQQILAQRDQLERTAASLRLADRTKDRMLAVVAHELRNPLASLQAGLRLLENTTSTEKFARIRGLMDQQINHLVRLIDDLLDVSRVSAGKISLRMETVVIDEAIAEAVETSRPLLEAAGHTLTVMPAGGDVQVRADRTRLVQIVVNLLNNAAKYTPAGGRVAVAALASPEQIEIAVIDNGLGIPLVQQSQIFQMFSQIDDHLGRAQGGVGIGLALVRELVQMHSGTIDVMSAGPGEGSTFTVRLPRLSVPVTVPGQGTLRMVGGEEAS